MDQPVTTSLLQTQTLPFCNATITWFDRDPPEELWDTKLKFVAYGVETCPTTGRKHLQMWASCVKPQRFASWKKIFPGAHIEYMRGTFEQNDKYCSKESVLKQLGEKPMENGKRKDLREFCDRVKDGDKFNDIVHDLPTVYVQFHSGLRSLSYLLSKPYEHDTVRGFWIWGLPGTGKSTYARKRFDDLYIKGQNKWFDGYNGERSILLDDYDAKESLGHLLKIWMDKFSCKGETKGGYVQLQHHHFVITSNYSIEEMFGFGTQLSDAITRRCEIIHTTPCEYLSV